MTHSHQLGLARLTIKPIHTKSNIYSICSSSALSKLISTRTSAYMSVPISTWS
jgi:hypothetical protein